MDYTQEARLAVVEQRDSAIISNVNEIRQDVKSILVVLNGNGKEGLCTRVSLVEKAQSISWWWLGGISLSVVGVAIYIVKSGILVV
jgi:hypothetical protein